MILRDGHNLNLPIGNYLGMLTNELLEFGPNAYIVRFTAIGPKSYSFVVCNPDDGKFTEISKCKGISKAIRNSKKLKFDTFKNLVDNSVETQRNMLTFENPKVKKN